MTAKRKQGELESEILGCLWDRPEGLSSQQVLALLGEDVKLTTVLTVLSRLEEKGFVNRRSGIGRSLRFFANSTREQHTASQLLALMGQSSNPAMVFSHFTSGLTEKQVAELRKVLEQ